ncbi:hypothetical protein FOYG_17573 [Fusarium oxysporum NRRL 32931]|uniref:Uncharacterized protein n=1 Tax=Fusarium oxysporum NRRL 32931 TaxID=660029 RepID=W9H9I9_FUSOX|nr:hypothetical protein FOYG_17573 [Fusarium oxysporum NRRL 32931]
MFFSTIRRKERQNNIRNRKQKKKKTEHTVGSNTRTIAHHLGLSTILAPMRLIAFDLTRKALAETTGTRHDLVTKPDNVLRKFDGL